MKTSNHKKCELIVEQESSCSRGYVRHDHGEALKPETATIKDCNEQVPYEGNRDVTIKHYLHWQAHLEADKKNSSFQLLESSILETSRRSQL
jgi:hypothetical protein